MDNLGKKSLALHKKYGGKLAVANKVPLDNLHDLCLAYTPGVAEVCKLITRDVKSARDYTIKKNTVAVITDGSAVLGLGNIGAIAGLPVMEGKAILLKKFANIDAFPLCLDTQDVEKIIQTIKIIAPVFGAIQLEDISAPRCFKIEKRLQQELDIPVLHDDQHSTAVVVLAALINSLKIKRLNKHRAQVVINGAGAAGIGIAELLLAYGFKNLIVLDSLGTLYSGRQKLSGEKKQLARQSNRQKIKGDLAQALREADVFIGVSKAGLLKPAMVKLMNNKPVVFALANPAPEIMPQDAKKAGAFIVATGRSDFPNQINNVLSFPGIFRGALSNRVRFVTQAMLIQAAKNLAALIPKPSINNILPSLFDKRVVKQVAKAIKN
jgi:malate dehydrogenase (oxaloacetate-decarboxylating)